MTRRLVLALAGIAVGVHGVAALFEDTPELPAVDHARSAHQLPIGETLSLDALGPIVVKEDGTTFRISNWNEMNDKEKQGTLRMVKKRNAERIAALQRQHL